MNLLFTICARAGSKGVKNKNIRSFLDSPLSYYTLSAYKLFCEQYGNNYDSISLALNTDSDELHEQIKRTDIEFVYIKRKETLAGDIVSKIEVIKDTVKEVATINNLSVDLIIDLDLTSPLRTAADIAGTIDTLMSNEFADVSFSVTGARRLPFFNMVMCQEDGSYGLVIKSDYVSRQQAPQCFDMNASIYVYKYDFITSEETKKVFDGKAVAHKMIDTAILDIDSEEDMELMEVLARYFFDKYADYGLVGKTAKTFQY